MTRPGEIGRGGRACCLYLTGHGSAPSPLGKIGIGKAEGDKSAYIDLMAEIGGALSAVDREEERLTKKKPSVNLLVKRWANYLLMVKSRNSLRTARKGARAALKEVQLGYPVDNLQEQEEAILSQTEALQFYARENEKLRRNKIYLQLEDVFTSELQRRGVRV